MARFNVTKLAPEGFLHHMAFDDVISSLSWSLAALGHDVNVTENWLSEHGERNIIFGAELAADHQRFPRGSILFNLEQPSHPNMEKVRRLARDCQVWDFSRRNLVDWQERGISATHVPIGYTPNLTRIPRATDQPIDVLFFGWMTPRRTALIDELRRYGLNVHATSACYGGGRDNLISRSKVVLNVHHDGRDMTEIVRVSFLMANSKCVVSEESVDSDEHSLCVPMAQYRGLVAACQAYVKDGHSRRQREELAFTDIRDRDFIATVERALDESPSKSHTLSGVPIVESESASPLTCAINTATFRPPSVVETFNALGPSLVDAPADPRVARRYSAAAASGDMKDFAPWLRDHAHGNIVEIGVRDGASTSAFLSGVEQHGGHVYSIDISDCSQLFPGHPQWTFIRADSKDFQSVIRRIPFELDVLLIDGDHSRAGVISDFQYARQLRAGGCVLFHDISPESRPSGCNDMSWPGDDVRTVFEEFASALASCGWRREELPGRYGMGVLWRPEAQPVSLAAAADSAVEAK